MRSTTGHRLTMRAETTSGVTGAVQSLTMDGPEARSGEGQQHGRVGGDGLRDVLSASKTGCHQSEGIASIEGGTRRTERLPSSATGLQQHTVGERSRAEAEHTEAIGVGVVDVGDEANRSPAPSDPAELIFEGVEATGGLQTRKDPVDDASFRDVAGVQAHDTTPVLTGTPHRGTVWKVGNTWR